MVDNDGDGWVDLDDPDCENENVQQLKTVIQAQCNDGADNDGDAKADALDPNRMMLMTA